jgi:hypothetical protein
MDFTYVASGSISVGGCSDYSWAELLVALYAVNDVVYLRFKARQGVLERICIKELMYGKDAYVTDVYGKRLCRMCNFSPIYKDNLNALYDEEDLCDEATALALAQNYVIQQRRQIERLAMTCGESAV